jgi:hypothetical protein
MELILRQINNSPRHRIQFVGALAKFRKATISHVISVCQSVRTHGTIRLPLDGFSWHDNLLFFENLWKFSSLFQMRKEIFNCNWVATRWLQNSTHLHTHDTQNDKKQTLHRTTQKFRKIGGRAPSWRVIPWHLSYNWGKARENNQGSWTIRIHRPNNKNT